MSYADLWTEAKSLTKLAKILRDRLHYSEGVIARLAFFYGLFRAIRLIESLRRPPKFISVAVNTLKTSRDRVLRDLKSAGIRARPCKEYDDLILIDVQGPFEIEDVGKRVVVKDKSAEEIMLGANLYAPGLLDMDPDIRIGDDVNIVTRFGEIIALGVSRVNAGEQAIRGAIVEVKKTLYHVPNLRTLRAFVLGEAYRIPVITYEALTWLAPQKGEYILCVSPAPEDIAYIIQRTEGEAEISIVAKTELEEERIKSELKRLKLTDYIENVYWKVEDFQYIHFDREVFDAILVRPRSSKIGLRPRISGFIKEFDILSLHNDAKRLLDRLVPALRRGGRLLYLNPSLDPAEGEVLTNYLVTNWGLSLEPKEYRWGRKGIEDIPTGDLVLRSYPDVMEDIGFFAALLVKE